jgi:DNA-binding MarR family transcriptional regulator
MRQRGKREPDPTPPAASVAGVAGSFDMGVLDQLLNFRLRRIRNHLTERYREETLAKGLRPGAFSVLALIDANPGIAQIDLARFGGYDQTALVGIIDDFEARGWARRTRDPADRRRHRIEATDDGREALKEMLARAVENERPACEVLDADELAAFRAALDKIYRLLL